VLCGIVVAIIHVSHRQAIGSPWVYPWIYPWIFPWISAKKTVDMDVDMDGKYHGKPGWSTKAAISLKRVKIEERSLWSSQTLFRTVPLLAPTASSSQDWGFATPNLKSVSLPVSEIIAIGLEFWARVANLQSRERGHKESGMVPLERALVGSYRPSIVTFHLSLRVSEIHPLLCSSTPLFPLHLESSPNFLMFPWE